MINEYPNGVIAQLLQAIIGQINFDGTPTSNIGDILLSILEQTPYDKEPKSVLAELFLKLKDKLEGRAFTPYDKEPKSAIAKILLSILNETEYDKEPNSRIAELLLELKSELESYAELTASGAIANFTTSVVKPLVNLTAYFKATQEAGTPTPQSPKAISGINAVNVVHCHKNIFDYDESKVTTGETTSATTRAYYPLNLDNCTLTFTARLKDGATPPSEFLNIGQIRETDGLIGIRDSFLAPTGITTRTLQFSKGNKAVFVCSTARLDLTKSLFEKYDIQIEVSSNASEFEPYAGSTTLINLGGTYYGCYITQDKNGKRELTVTHNYFLMDNSVNVAVNSQSANTVVFSLSLSENDIPNTDSTSYLSDRFSPLTPSDTEGRGILASNGYFYFVIAKEHLSSYDQKGARAWLENNLTVLITSLAEPFTIALPDGEPITAFNGVNNIYNDSGDTSVTYLAKIADNLNATAKLRAEVKAQMLKAKEELKEDVKELEPIMDSGETKRGA